MGSLSEKDKARLRREGFPEHSIDAMDRYSTGVDFRAEREPSEDDDDGDQDDDEGVDERDDGDEQ